MHPSLCDEKSELVSSDVGVLFVQVRVQVSTYKEYADPVRVTEFLTGLIFQHCQKSLLLSLRNNTSLSRLACALIRRAPLIPGVLK
jgi:hypothetical protein